MFDVLIFRTVRLSVTCFDGWWLKFEHIKLISACRFSYFFCWYYKAFLFAQSANEVKCVNLVFAGQRRSHWSSGWSYHRKLLQPDIPRNRWTRNCAAWWWKLCHTGCFLFICLRTCRIHLSLQKGFFFQGTFEIKCS